MILTIASYKGGVGKTTSAVHFAAFLQLSKPTLLLDADKTRNALGWAKAAADGKGLSFQTAPYSQAARLVPEYAHGHVVIDTGQRLEGNDLREAVEAGDLLVIPAAPATLDTRSLVMTLQALRELGTTKYRVLLTKVPPPPEREAMELRKVLRGEGVPIFEAEIPRLKAFEKAAAFGVAANEVEDRNAARAWAAYMAAGRELSR